MAGKPTAWEQWGALDPLVSAASAAASHTTKKPTSGGWLQKHHLGFVGTVLDIVDRPRNAIVSGLAHHGDPGNVIGFGDFWKGLTGQEHTSGSELIPGHEHHGGVARALTGFGLDVGLDPISYLGLGLAEKGGKAAESASAGRRAAEAVPQARRATPPPVTPTPQEIIRPALAAAKKPIAALPPGKTIEGEGFRIIPPLPGIEGEGFRIIPHDHASIQQAIEFARRSVLSKKAATHPGAPPEVPEYTSKWFEQLTSKPGALTDVGEKEAERRLKRIRSETLTKKIGRFESEYERKFGLGSSEGHTIGEDAMKLLSHGLKPRLWKDATPEERKNILAGVWNPDTSETVAHAWTRITGLPPEAAIRNVTGDTEKVANLADVIRDMHVEELAASASHDATALSKHADDMKKWGAAVENYKKSLSQYNIGKGVIEPERIGKRASVNASEKAAQDIVETSPRVASEVQRANVAETTAGVKEALSPEVRANVERITTEFIDSIKNPRGGIKRGSTFNNINQQNLLNRLNTYARTQLRLSGKKRAEFAAAMLKHAETVVVQAGLPATHRDGPFSLANFLVNALKQRKFTVQEWNNLLSRATYVDDLAAKFPREYTLARSASLVDEAQNITVPAVDATLTNAAAEIAKGAPINEIRSEAGTVVQDIVKQAGGSNAAQSSARAGVLSQLPGGTVPAATERDVAKAGFSTKPPRESIVASRNRIDAIDKRIGIYVFGQPTRFYIPGSGPVARAVSGLPANSKIVGGLSAALNNAYGEELVHEDFRMYIMGAYNKAGDRLRVYRNMFDGYKGPTGTSQIADAWELAQAGSSAGNELATAMESRMNDLTRTIKRAGLTKNELNDFFRKGFGGIDNPHAPKIIETVEDTVTKKRVKIDPADSWRHWNLKPQEIPGWMHHAEIAVEKAVARRQFIDYLVREFGVKSGGTTIANPVFRGARFENEVAPQITRVMQHWTEALNDPVNNKLVKLYDTVLRKWKAGVTIYSPSHHIRNMMGDMFLSFLDGVHNPIRYRQAAKVILKKINHYESGMDLDVVKMAGYNLERITDPDALVRAINDPAGQVIFTHPKFGDVTAEQLYTGYSTFGGKQNIAITEQLNEVMTTQSAMKKVGAAARKVSETREDIARMAHFIDAVGKSQAGTLEQAMRDSMKRVRKFHFDYGDLTKFEQNTMKRIVPFYTWTRKSTPLLLEHFFLQPGKMMAYYKAQFAITQAAGYNPAQISFPFDDGTAALLPSWMTNSGAVPIGEMHPDDPYLSANFSTPFNDMMQQFSQGPVGALSNVSPILRMPVELFAGKQFYGGGDIPITDRSEYVTQQIPLANIASRMTNTDPTGALLQSTRGEVDNPGAYNEKPAWQTKNYGDPEGGPANMVALINWLTGLGTMEATQRRQRFAQYEQRQSGGR
jgi:hypothetical protein